MMSIMRRKHHGQPMDHSTCMVVFNNLVSGKTVYYKTQLVSYKSLESAILVSRNDDGNFNQSINQ